jgi:hypothetical protein
LAGVNLHTWTGFGSVPYWNAYVAATEMHGSGTYFDARLSNPEQYPVAAKSGSWNTRGVPDKVTSKLAALHFYQLAIPAPKPPMGALTRARQNTAKKSSMARANVRAAMCRRFSRSRGTAPLAGLWSHANGGFYHDGRFATLQNVVEHYNGVLHLGLSESEESALVEYLKSL